MKKTYYTIGEMSTICNVSAKALRYYDEIDLIKPDYKNPENGYRYYTHDQAFNIYIVKKLQALDFCLDEIKELQQDGSMEAIEAKISKKLDGIDRKISKLNGIKTEGQKLIEKLHEHDNIAKISSTNASPELTMTPEEIKEGKVQIEETASRVVLSSKKMMKLYNNFEISIDRWLDIYNQSEANDLGTDGNIILMYHTETPMDQFYEPECMLEVMLPISNPAGSMLASDQYAIKTLPGYMAVVTYHYGSYESIIHAHLRVMRWLKEKRYRLYAPTFEEYLISPFDPVQESNYLTKIIYPIASKNPGR